MKAAAAVSALAPVLAPVLQAAPAGLYAAPAGVYAAPAGTGRVYAAPAGTGKLYAAPGKLFAAPAGVGNLLTSGLTVGGIAVALGLAAVNFFAAKSTIRRSYETSGSIESAANWGGAYASFGLVVWLIGLLANRR